jgi:predicted Fe-Mo cluster-binding NifX family protein
MKIAIPTEDRINIFERTGQTPLFAIATIEQSNITHIGYRMNPPHKYTGKDHSHAETAKLIQDCDLLLVKKLGKHLQADLDAAGIRYQKVSSQRIGDAIHEFLSA